MYTENMLNNDITTTKRTIARAESELNSLKQQGRADDWKAESLQELIDDGLEALDDMRSLRRKHNEGKGLVYPFYQTYLPQSDGKKIA